MSTLSKPSHEQFAQLVSTGQSASQAYLTVFGPRKGFGQSAHRLLKNAEIRARVAEISAGIGSKMLTVASQERAIGLRDRNFRLKALQRRWDLCNRLLEERAAAYGNLTADGAPMEQPRNLAGSTDAGEVPDAGGILRDRAVTPAAPGAGTGILCLDWRGKDAVQAVWKFDAALLNEMRKIEAQVARELGELDPEPNTGTGVACPVQINVAFVTPR